MNWGVKIAIGLSLFVGMIIYMVVTCMRQPDIHLVANDYYEQEIAYQTTIDKMNNLQELGVKPTLENMNGGLIADFSTLPEFESIKGEIKFFRPSDPKLDFIKEIKLTQEGKQYIDVSKGKWIIKLNWSNEGKAYYMEQNMIL